MRWLRAAAIVGLLAGFGVVVGATPAFACSCKLFSPQEMFDRSDVVFVGTATALEDSNAAGPTFSSADPITVTFDVSEVRKGTVPASAKVRTARSEISCGYEFAKGGHYLVYAGVDTDGAWVTGLCQGTTVVPVEEPRPTTSAAPTTTFAAAPPVAQSSSRGWVIGLGAGLVGLAAAGWLVRWRRRRNG
jgi:hypothetical protein